MEKMREVVADDVTDIVMTNAGYYWWAGHNEFDFDCKIKGVKDKLHLTEYRHDEGSGIVICSEKDDIWERMNPSEIWKLDVKLREEIAYRTYHNQLATLKTADDCRLFWYELIDDESIYLKKSIPKLLSELHIKEAEIDKHLQKAEKKQHHEQLIDE